MRWKVVSWIGVKFLNKGKNLLGKKGSVLTFTDFPLFFRGVLNDRLYSHSSCLRVGNRMGEQQLISILRRTFFSFSTLGLFLLSFCKTDTSWIGILSQNFKLFSNNVALGEFSVPITRKESTLHFLEVTSSFLFEILLLPYFLDFRLYLCVCLQIIELGCYIFLFFLASSVTFSSFLL